MTLRETYADASRKHGAELEDREFRAFLLSPPECTGPAVAPRHEWRRCDELDTGDRVCPEDLGSVRGCSRYGVCTRDNYDVVVNDLTGDMIQISNRNASSWSPVWNDPRFAPR